MAEEKVVKPSLVSTFRLKIQTPSESKEAILEGLKSTNAKIRAAAIKFAFKLKDHEIIKKNVLPLLAAEKSKKVLRAVAGKITRKDLDAKVHSLLAKKVAKDAPAKAAAGAEVKS
jgi:hypothetical protein